MKRKILDILPPGKASFKEPEVLVKEKKEKIIPDFKKGKAAWIWFLFFSILAIGGVVGFQLSKAEIKIWPETENEYLKSKIIVSTGLSEPDFENRILPGNLQMVEETVSETFSSSGKILKNAEGIIRLYNAYSNQPENWLEGTRFVSSGGKIFKSKSKISVPGADTENGKIVPVYVDVPVVAAEPGPDYNIGPSHFSIYVFRGTDRYTKFYGESFDPMTGGGESSQVTAEDIEKAEEELIEEAKEKALENLHNKIGPEYVFLEDASEIEILDVFNFAKEGDEVDRFNVKATVEAKIVVFSEIEARDLVKRLIAYKTPVGEQKRVYEESLEISYTPQAVDFDLGEMDVSLSSSAKLYPDIDLDSIKNSLAGSSSEKAQELLRKQPDVINAEIKLWPFWVRNVPGDIKKIEIEYPLID